MMKKISRWSVVLLTYSLFTQVSAKKYDTLPLPLRMTVNTLTLEKAVILAHKHRPNLEGLKYAIQASTYEAKQELSPYFPQIGITSIIQQSKGEKSPNTSIEFGARQLIYQFGGPVDRYHVARKRTDVVQFLTESEKQSVRHEVEIAFLQAWLLQQQLTAIKSLYASTTEVFKRAEHQNKLDLLDKKDWLKNNADYADDIATIGVYDNDTVIAERTLEYLLGQRVSISLNQERFESEQKESQNAPTQLMWNPEDNIKAHPFNHYYELALKNRPDYASNKKLIEIAHDSIGIIRKTNLPVVSMFAKTAHFHESITFDPQAGFSKTPRGFHQVGAQIDWNIFDGALTHFRASKAEADKVKSILDAEQTRQKIKIDVETAFYNLSKSLTQLRAREVRLAQAKNDFVLAQQNFSIGNISQVDLSAAKTMWEQEHLKWLSQKSEAAQRHSDLLFACGYPAELTL